MARANLTCPTRNDPGDFDSMISGKIGLLLAPSKQGTCAVLETGEPPQVL